MKVSHPTLAISNVDGVEFYEPCRTVGTSMTTGSRNEDEEESRERVTRLSRNVVVFGLGQIDRSP
eukprot:scaffold21575_cov142-Amphora_coffeaeformis.AAC.1